MSIDETIDQDKARASSRLVHKLLYRDGERRREAGSFESTSICSYDHETLSIREYDTDYYDGAGHDRDGPIDLSVYSGDELVLYSTTREDGISTYEPGPWIAEIERLLGE